MLVIGSALQRITLPDRVTVVSLEEERFRVTRYEASVLIIADAVQAHVHPRSHELWYFRLRVARQRFFGLLKGIRSLESPSGVTRARQSPGACKWVPRHDRAHTGQFATVRSVFV